MKNSTILIILAVVLLMVVGAIVLQPKNNTVTDDIVLVDQNADGDSGVVDNLGGDNPEDQIVAPVDTIPDPMPVVDPVYPTFPQTGFKLQS